MLQKVIEFLTPRYKQLKNRTVFGILFVVAFFIRFPFFFRDYIDRDDLSICPRRELFAIPCLTIGYSLNAYSRSRARSSGPVQQEEQSSPLRPNCFLVDGAPRSTQHGWNAACA